MTVDKIHESMMKYYGITHKDGLLNIFLILILTEDFFRTYFFTFFKKQWIVMTNLFLFIYF